MLATKFPGVIPSIPTALPPCPGGLLNTRGERFSPIPAFSGLGIGRFPVSTATAVRTDVKVVGYKTSKRVELESDDFRLQMTPAKALELAQALMTVLREIR